MFVNFLPTEGSAVDSQISAAEFDNCNKQLSGSVYGGFGEDEKSWSTKATTGYGEELYLNLNDSLGRESGPLA